MQVSQVRILASTSVPFGPKTVQMSNLAGNGLQCSIPCHKDQSETTNK
jgi:hypothetical protein